ncbi:hypothetical protein DFJ73DRAFT_52735 [Zopfochytrium polystomum]|nr:hypothetical protein DFJ73DRAFT_52735 [Zopfochytrium polystomum]
MVLFCATTNVSTFPAKSHPPPKPSHSFPPTPFPTALPHPPSYPPSYFPTPTTPFARAVDEASRVHIGNKQGNPRYEGKPRTYCCHHDSHARDDWPPKRGPAEMAATFSTTVSSKSNTLSFESTSRVAGSAALTLMRSSCAAMLIRPSTQAAVAASSFGASTAASELASSFSLWNAPARASAMAGLPVLLHGMCSLVLPVALVWFEGFCPLSASPPSPSHARGSLASSYISSKRSTAVAKLLFFPTAASASTADPGSLCTGPHLSIPLSSSAPSPSLSISFALPASSFSSDESASLSSLSPSSPSLLSPSDSGTTLRSISSRNFSSLGGNSGSLSGP